MSSNIQHTNDASFEDDVIKSGTPVLVDYWAEWCGPCRGIAPVLEELAVEFADKVKIVKVNVDENQDTAAKYGIRAIPTLMLFKNGVVVETSVGGKTKSQIAAFVQAAI